MKLAMNCEVPRQLLKLSKKNVLQNQPSLEADASEVIICYFHLYIYIYTSGFLKVTRLDMLHQQDI